MKLGKKKCLGIFKVRFSLQILLCSMLLILISMDILFISFIILFINDIRGFK